MKKQPFLNADIQIEDVNLDIRGSSRNELELFYIRKVLQIWIIYVQLHVYKFGSFSDQYY